MSNVVRFARLGGVGNESVNLEPCLELLVGPPHAITVYHLTPKGRAILGFGGMRQLLGGGAGYLEVHPLQVAREMHLSGQRLPTELEHFLPILKLGLTQSESIAAWEKSRPDHASNNPADLASVATNSDNGHLAADEEWLSASAARKLAKTIGIKVSFQTMKRAIKQNQAPV